MSPADLCRLWQCSSTYCPAPPAHWWCDSDTWFIHRGRYNSSAWLVLEVLLVMKNKSDLQWWNEYHRHMVKPPTEHISVFVSSAGLNTDSGKHPVKAPCWNGAFINPDSSLLYLYTERERGMWWFQPHKRPLSIVFLSNSCFLVQKWKQHFGIWKKRLLLHLLLPVLPQAEYGRYYVFSFWRYCLLMAYFCNWTF